MNLYEKIQEAKSYIESRTQYRPTVGVILGSGLGQFVNEIQNPVIFPYKDIPHFHTTSVQRHVGRLFIGRLEGKTVMMLQGRLHYYEGLSLETVTIPVRVMKACGVNSVIITNASGAINPDLNPADVMIITDHINVAGVNPLIGPNDNRLGPRFLDLTTLYDRELREIALKVGEKENLKLQQGVYAWYSGPSVETPAEIRMLRILGADAVGMSTVPEAIVAHHSGMRVLGIACMANMAAGITDEKVNAQTIDKNLNQARSTLFKLIKGVLREMA